MRLAPAVDTLPEPGTVLDSRPLPDAFWPDNAADAIRVVYQGLGYDGAGREVSGSVFLPNREAPPGGWPIVSYAHGTTGLSDHCAPSRTGLSRLERAHVSRWLAAGFVVAATDYEGLATPGPHPYFNGEAVADDVVDIVRAARLLDSGVGRTWLVAGFSQGGHAALFVGLMATRYAPELDFRGTVAIAPPVHLPMLVSVVTEDGVGPVSVFLLFLLAGLRTSHPGFDARCLLTDVGGKLIEAATSATLVDLYRASAQLTNDDTGITRLHTRPGVDPILTACRVPVSRMDRPVFVTAGSADEIVPVAVVERFVADLMEAGTSVDFGRHEGATHADMLASGHQQLIAWSELRLSTGEPPSHPARFTLFDANDDGYLGRDDYEAFALRLVQAFGEPPGSPKAVAVRHGYRTLWEAVAARSDTDADGLVSQAEFVHWLDSRPDGFDQEILPLAEAVVALADDNRSGELDTAEFRRLLRACDLTDDQVAAVFDTLDSNRDGSVSVAEILDAIRDFCLDPVPGKPGHWLFGRF
jgi:acetyl esterase/lipase